MMFYKIGLCPHWCAWHQPCDKVAVAFATQQTKRTHYRIMDTNPANPAAPAAPATVTAVPAAPVPAAPAPQTPVPAAKVAPVNTFAGKGRKNRQLKVQK